MAIWGHFRIQARMAGRVLLPPGTSMSVAAQLAAAAAAALSPFAKKGKTTCGKRRFVIFFDADPVAKLKPRAPLATPRDLRDTRYYRGELISYAISSHLGEAPGTPGSLVMCMKRFRSMAQENRDIGSVGGTT